MAKRVTYTRGVTDCDTTTYGVLLDGEQVGTVEGVREGRTEWWASGYYVDAEGHSKRYSSGYGRPTRKHAVTDLIAAGMNITRAQAQDIVDAS